jgi:alkylation response protein AidB-like acyl-CoA dehydrogenase
VRGSELLQATTELMLEVAGPFVMPFADPPVGPDYAASVGAVYFNLRKVSIFGGTNEIQRNIIAKAILGL